MNDIEHLSSYRHCVTRIEIAWPGFLQKRRERLAQQDRYGTAAEKVAENIIEDLFTEVLDWSISDLNNQVGYADILLSQLGIKHLLIEAKRPGALAWKRNAVFAALDQAMRYAAEQKVKRIAVSDGIMLYAADVEHGGLIDRVFVSLEDQVPPVSLWWLSVHGVYRELEAAERGGLQTLPEQPDDTTNGGSIDRGDEILHHKYKIPARCFAYVGNASNPSTWHLPYLLADGSPDVGRLPKAIQAILSNYRGARVSSVPEKDIPDVLVRLARTSAHLGRMPFQSPGAAAVYAQLEEALRQIDRLRDVTGQENTEA